jgi:two-component system response regulator YesN
MIKHRALIVDDEFAAREMLRRLADWDAAGFEMPVMATNGKEALQLCQSQRFDLIFADIEMPVMDGLTFIAELHKLNQKPRIVIISCHEKFEYAHRALKLGAEDYIIKDLMTPNELQAILCSAVLGDSVPGKPVKPGEDLNLMLQEAVLDRELEDRPLPKEHCAVFLVVPDDYERLSFEQSATAVSLKMDLFAKESDCLAFYYNRAGAVYMLCSLQDSDSSARFINNALVLAESIRCRARRHGLTSVSIGVSDSIENLSALQQACRQAQEAANVRVIAGTGKTILYNSISVRKNLLDFDRLDQLFKRLEDLAYHANVSCVKIVDRLYSAELSSGFADANSYRYINERLWTIMIILAQTRGYPYEKITREMGLDLGEINQMTDKTQITQLFKSFLTRMIATEAGPDSKDIVQNALTLIENEYMTDISLNYIADKLHVHKSYLCRLFKDEVGENIMQYILDMKIKRAKYLLANSHMKLYEISDSLGFTSQQYFSYVFKKQTGSSPNEFKRTQLP